MDSTFGNDFLPFFGLPIQCVDGVELPLVGSAPTKHNQSITLWIVTHGAIGSVLGYLSPGFHLLPLFNLGVVAPDVILIDGV